MRYRLCYALLGLVLGALACPLPVLADVPLLQDDAVGGHGAAVAWERVIPGFRDATLTAVDRKPGVLSAGAAGALGLLLIGLAIGCVLVALRFLRPASLARVLPLGCAPAAVLTGCYLLLNERHAASGDAGGIAIAPVATRSTAAGSPDRGRGLFATNCVTCHGMQGRGDGPVAATLNPRPANLADGHMITHRDSDLYGFISNGIPGSAMAAWQGQLTERERWDLVAYLRTLAPTATGATSALDEPAGSRPPARLSDEPMPSTLSGELVYAADGRLWSLNVEGGSPVDLTPGRSRDTLAAEPAMAPDGVTLAFTLLALPALGAVGTPVGMPGSNIYLLDLRDGSQRRMLTHDRPGALIESLQWAPDGRALIYGDSTPVLDADGRLGGTSHTVRRLDLDTGRRSTLVEDARSPALSRDGTTLAYVASDPDTFATSLWLADADGENRRQLVGAQGTFADFLAPRFSPDGTRLVFSAAGGPGVEPPPPSPSSSGRSRRFLRWLVAPLAPPSVAAHGLPGDLWLVGRDGRGSSD